MIRTPNPPTLEELEKAIAAVIAPGFQLQHGNTFHNTFSLKIDGEYFCYHKSPEEILWAITHPGEWRQQQDTELAELDDLLADLKGA
jgi:hypothetical protein